MCVSVCERDRDRDSDSDRDREKETEKKQRYYFLKLLKIPLDLLLYHSPNILKSEKHTFKKDSKSDCSAGHINWSLYSGAEPCHIFFAELSIP